MVQPSCPACLIHDDDGFRRTLITTLDQRNFTVSFAEDGDAAIELLRSREFRVVLLAIDLRSRRGLQSLEYLHTNREAIRCGVIILGDPDPAIRTIAPWADETFLKPVDPEYVVMRARSYCGC